MSRSLPAAVLALCFSAALLGGPVLAENEGLDDLDRATELKIAAASLSDLGEVIRLCESALEKGLDEDNARFAKLLLAATRSKRGSSIAETILTTPPDAMWPHYRRVALDDLEKALQLDPDQPGALYLVARLNALPGGDRRRALEAADQAVRLIKTDLDRRVKALVLRAALQEDSEKRLADLDEAVRTSPGDAATLHLRGALYAELHRHEEALADFDSVLKIEPSHSPTYLKRGEVMIELERYDEALASLAKAHELLPQSVEPLVHQARAHAFQSNFNKALEVLEQAYALDPANLLVLLLRANVHQELGDEDKALADVDQVLTLSPGLPLAMRFRADLLARTGEFDMAAAQLEKLLEAEPEDPEAQLQLAYLYTAEKQHRKAIEKFSAVLRKQPENAAALRGRADVLLSVGRQAEAITDYEKVLALEPEDSHVLNNLAWVLATSPDGKLRDGKRAIELATKACEVTDYKEAHILSTLGAGYAETGDFKTAIQWSQKAIELGSEDQLEPLKKELQSYRAGEPVRELMTEPEEPEEPEEPGEPESDKPEQPEPPPPEQPGPQTTPPSDAAPEGGPSH